MNFQYSLGGIRISSSSNRNITPTQNEHKFVTPESNLKSDALWFRISPFSEKTHKQFSELQECCVRMEKLMASMEKIVKALQEGHNQLRKASEETKRRLNQVLEEKHHCKRDRDFLDRDLTKFFNVYQR
ncbi:hypothetical protein O181_044169 [Austropuccinia psidii MF-1]|uniref:Uncharacterized protein n=1 Tax=Austropuccinia psidii MF-1 TaxID=1389203 RepID=A0A9Q3DJH9_9BASI|nr:hypothetical protein [Austropuccinia psidii MF-1]